MQRDSDRQGDEDAWRAIVENYGDRAALEDEDVTPALPEPAVGPVTSEAAPPAPVWEDEPDDPEDRFVPPVPPPLPPVSTDRMFAWIGLFGAPALLLLCLVVGFALPAVVSYLLVAAFIGGFVYLVVTMPHGPDDPFDDGARI